MRQKFFKLHVSNIYRENLREDITEDYSGKSEYGRCY